MTRVICNMYYYCICRRNKYVFFFFILSLLPLLLFRIVLIQLNAYLTSRSEFNRNKLSKSSCSLFDLIVTNYNVEVKITNLIIYLRMCVDKFGFMRFFRFVDFNVVRKLLAVKQKQIIVVYRMDSVDHNTFIGSRQTYYHCYYYYFCKLKLSVS